MADENRKRSKWDDPVGSVNTKESEAIKTAIEVAKRLKVKLEMVQEDKGVNESLEKRVNEVKDKSTSETMDKGTIETNEKTTSESIDNRLPIHHISSDPKLPESTETLSSEEPLSPPTALAFTREFNYTASPEHDSIFKAPDFPVTLKSKLQLGSKEDFVLERTGDFTVLLKGTSEDILDLAEKECQAVRDTGKFRSLKPGKFTERINLTFTPLPAQISLVRGKLLGPQGSFLKHIQSSTKTRVQLRGKGSGYFEVSGPVAEGSEPEPMHLVVEGSDRESVKEAKQLCEDLVATVKSEFDAKIASYPNPQYPLPPYTNAPHPNYPNYPYPQYPHVPYPYPYAYPHPQPQSPYPTAQYQNYQQQQQQAALYAQYYAQFLQDQQQKSNNKTI